MQQAQEKLRIKLLGDVGHAVEIPEHFQQNCQTRISNVSLSVFDGPNDRVDHHLENLARNEEKCAETFLVDLLQQRVKVDAVLGKVLHVGRNHRQGAFKHRTENLRHLIGNGIASLADDGGKDREYLWIPSLRV